MKKFALAAILAAISVPAAAAPGDSAFTSGTATATIVSPIAISHSALNALAFGTITPGTAAGSVTVTTGGVGSDDNEANLLTGSTNSADLFTVTGDANRSFGIVTTGGSVTSGGNSMTFTTALASATGTLSGTGSTTFNVGGTLSVGANQAAGGYTGSYTATVTYN